MQVFGNAANRIATHFPFAAVCVEHLHPCIGNIRGVNDDQSVTANAETAIELTYQRPLGAGFSVQPDVQYVLNPGFERDLDNAWVLTVRLSYELPEM